ncbi:alpha/beta fold hydrolase [Actinoplanes sp. NPDC051861]|uniref:alpha/beta hydrolase family esterase n=1 Tax=Actinoplanes sp. NPDC051861 TaxID=3155170 RepID=UPI00343764A0
MSRNGGVAARIVLAVVVVMAAVSCGSTGASKPASSPSVAALPESGTSTVEIGGRPVTVHVPESYDPAKAAAPLVVLLHGYSSFAKEQESYFKLTPESDRRGFVYVYPDGTVDDRGDRFWNATDACCDFFDAQPDDSRYLSELIATIQREYRIDRVYLIGHSNGGFMAFRMACDHADQVTAVASLNGATWNDATKCRPSEPVSVLAVHGDADETIAFGGGSIDGSTYPSAATTVAQWREHDGCTGDGREAAAVDLVGGAPAETSVRAWDCTGNATVQAWTIDGGTHVPPLGPGFAPAVTDFLLAQRD